MFEKFEPQGLVMLALSDESEGTITRFMEANPMPYPIGTGDKSARSYGVRGIPAAFLIDHKGEIVWQGHPGGGGWEAMLPKLLGEARDAGPTWDPGERPAALDKAVAAAKEGKLREAIKQAEYAAKEDEAAATAFLADLQACVERRVDRARAMADEGRYFEAVEYLDLQAGAFHGTPHAAAFSDQASAWSRDKEVKALLALDKKRMQANDDARKGKADKAAKSLEKLVKSAEGTALEAAVAADLERAQKSLR